MKRSSPLTCSLVSVLSALPLAAQQTAPQKRYPIPVARMIHETGSAYLVRMDFGEDGDKETGNKSGIRLLEDGKELGPGRSLHADIRAKGKGRYSHWTRNGLYFSASDNSDPRTNGRTYEVYSVNPDNALGGLRDKAGKAKTHTEVITRSDHAYRVELGGDLDMDNTMTRSHSGITIAFQPNIQLTIANTGDTPVRWPKLVANGERDWSTFDSLLADFTRGATNDREKALCIWESMRQSRYHSLPLFPDDEFHDPVKMFNSYGLQLCDDMGYAGCSIFKRAGLGKPTYDLDPTVYALYGHVQCEAVVDNALQFLDIDQDVFYLDRESERPVSGTEVAHDHDLARREVHYGPVFGNWSSSDSAAALFGPDDTRSFKAVGGHEMSYTLRPGERVVFRWDNVEKWVAHSKKWDRRPIYFGNSRFVYEPRLENGMHKTAVAAETDIVPPTVEGAGLAGGSPKAMLEYEMAIPWAICGGKIRAEFVGLAKSDRFAIDLTLDGKNPKRIWEGSGAGSLTCEASLDEALEPRVAPVHYKYRLVVTLASGDQRHGANLKSLRIETDVMTAPLSLPRLRRGENVLRYTDRQEGPREITITHEWREVHGFRPPDPPQRPDYPPDGQVVRDSLLTFRWPKVDGAGAYHIRVSRRADFRYPYRPGYDVVINTNQWLIPYSGMFAPDTTYFWRVRARNKAGVWSDWGPTWTFRWQGPRVPLELRHSSGPDGITLLWKPNPRGERPVRYDVYGSDEKGFSTSKRPFQAYTRGTVPANFLGTTTGTSMLVVSANPSHDNMNRAFYRVVAIDANGAESICSAYAEMPHPYIWSAPVTTARRGRKYAYRPGVITSLGDVQHRYEKPGNQLWDTEKHTFSLAQAPDWLNVDPESGLISGRPDAEGVFPVKLDVATQFGKTATQAFSIRVTE